MQRGKGKGKLTRTYICADTVKGQLRRNLSMYVDLGHLLLYRISAGDMDHVRATSLRRSSNVSDLLNRDFRLESPGASSLCWCPD